jgi:hypothetical protein
MGIKPGRDKNKPGPSNVCCLSQVFPERKVRKMRRTIVSIPAATAIAVFLGSGFAASNAQAGFISDIGESASFSGGGIFELISLPPLDMGDTIELTWTSGDVVGAVEEFTGLTSTTDLVGLAFTFTLGPINPVQQFDIPYDRSNVTDVADGNTAGSETGTLQFTLHETTLAQVVEADPGSEREWDLRGTFSITDLNGFYFDAVGEWALSGTIGEAAVESTFSLTQVTDQRTTGQEITAPATLALLGAGLLGLGVMVSRRFYG